MLPAITGYFRVSLIILRFFICNLKLLGGMTEERIDKVVRRLKEIAATDYSDYAGFHLKAAKNMEYNNCFIVNGQSTYSSNFTLQLENFSDAIKIIQGFTGKTKEETIENLKSQGYYVEDPPLYLHYLKLPRECEENW